VSIITENIVSQPLFTRSIGPDVRTVIAPNTRIDVTESGATSVSMPGNNTVADLVAALTKVKTSARDMIAIMQAIKAAGALHAELIIQ
jgi:flagellar P-ring protein precursor FlgI